MLSPYVLPAQDDIFAFDEWRLSRRAVPIVILQAHHIPCQWLRPRPRHASRAKQRACDERQKKWMDAPHGRRLHQPGSTRNLDKTKPGRRFAAPRCKPVRRSTPSRIPSPSAPSRANPSWTYARPRGWQGCPPPRSRSRLHWTTFVVAWRGLRSRWDEP